MNTTVAISITIAKIVDKYKSIMNFKYRGEAVSFLLKNADAHIKKRGMDSLLMQNEEVQLTTPMTIPKVSIVQAIRKTPREVMYKKSLDSPLYTNPMAWRLWVYCLDKMVDKKKNIHKPGSSETTLLPGSLLVTMRDIEQEIGIPFDAVRKNFKQLEKHNLVTTKLNKRSGTIISIVDYPVS